MSSLMKGHCWLDRVDAVDRKGQPIVKFPVWAETKHDEIRCHVIVKNMNAQFLSYAGKPLANMQEFAHLFVELVYDEPCAGYSEFDCGFEVNGNFNDSYRWVRSTKELPDDLANKPCTVQFYLYDLPQCSLPWRDRMLTRARVAFHAGKWMSAPEGRWLSNKDAVLQHFHETVAQGFEGLMLKQEYHTYQRGKRTDGWLKLKPEETADGRITGLLEATATVANPERGIAVGDGLGRIGSVAVVAEDGATGSPHGIPHELGRRMYQYPEEFIGEWCEFKYMEKDRQGGFRHPTFKRMREAKQ